MNQDDDKSQVDLTQRNHKNYKLDIVDAFRLGFNRPRIRVSYGARASSESLHAVQV